MCLTLSILACASVLYIDFIRVTNNVLNCSGETSVFLLAQNVFLVKFNTSYFFLHFLGIYFTVIFLVLINSIFLLAIIIQKSLQTEFLIFPSGYNKWIVPLSLVSMSGIIFTASLNFPVRIQPFPIINQSFPTAAAAATADIDALIFLHLFVLFRKGDGLSFRWRCWFPNSSRLRNVG